MRNREAGATKSGYKHEYQQRGHHARKNQQRLIGLAEQCHGITKFANIFENPPNDNQTDDFIRLDKENVCNFGSAKPSSNTS